MTIGPERSASSSALDRTLLSGFRWNAAGKVSGQMLAWASTFVVVRLLTPADYGVVAMGGVVFGLAALVGDGGLGGAILNRRETRQEHLGQLTTISVFLGSCAMGLTLLLALPVSVYFGEPQVRSVVAVASIAFVVLGFRTVPVAVLQRDLAFKLLARNDFLMVGSTAISAILLAAAGAAYWALIVAPIIGSLVATIAAWQARPQRLRVPRFADLRGTLEFGMHLMLSRMAGYAGSQADSLIIGRVLGKPPLGVYRVAMDLAALPIEKVASLILQVTTPVLAAVRGDREASARYLCRITEVVTLVAWPLTFGLALVADLVVPLVIGAHWNQAILPLQIFAISGAVRCATPLLSGVVLASGDARFAGRVSLLTTAISIPGMIFAAKWGLPALATVAALTITLTALALLWRALTAIGVPLSRYVAALSPAALGTVAMTFTVVAARANLPDLLHPALHLASVVGLGAVGYIGAVFLLARPRVYAAINALRGRTTNPVR